MSCELTEVAGHDAALILSQTKGGTRLYIPHHQSPLEDDHELVQLVGREAALKIQAYFGNAWLWIPKYIAEADRNFQITLDYRAGMNYAQLAEKYGISERWVRRITSAKPPKSAEKGPTYDRAIP